MASLRVEPSPGRRSRARNGGRKQSVDERLLAAMERLLERGHNFATISIEQLTREAGMSRGTFYWHFQDKGDLVARLTDHMAREVLEQWQQTGGGDLRRTGKSDVHAAVKNLLRIFQKHHAIVAAMLSMTPHDPSVAALYKHMVDQLVDYGQRVFAAVAESGRSRPGADANAARTLVWAYMHCASRMVADSETHDIDELADALAFITNCTLFPDAESADSTRA